MKTCKLVTIIIFAFCVFTLTACSSFTSGKKDDASQTSGLGEQEGFGDGNSPANRLKAPYNQTYRFGFDRYDVQSEDVESIKVQANYLTTHPTAKLRLEGNTDERGSREYNIVLGWKRAQAVAAILKEQGVNASQIAMISYGKEKPVALGHDEDSYSQNRRVELIYEAK